MMSGKHHQENSSSSSVLLHWSYKPHQLPPKTEGWRVVEPLVTQWLTFTETFQGKRTFMEIKTEYSQLFLWHIQNNQISPCQKVPSDLNVWVQKTEEDLKVKLNEIFLMLSWEIFISRSRHTHTFSSLAKRKTQQPVTEKSIQESWNSLTTKEN